MTTPPSMPASNRTMGRADLATAVHAVALLRRPFWARALLLVLALSVLFVLLGRWQYGRHEVKVARNARVNANYGASPVPLAEVLATPGASLPPEQEWRPIRVGGRYQPAGTVLIRNRPLDGVYGYEVVVPLRTDAGPVLLVDRGWVPNGRRSAAEPDQVPAPPPGHVDLVARLRPSEPPLDRSPPAGQEFRIDIPAIAAGLPDAAYAAYGVLAGETPAAPQAPQRLPAPDLDLGPHLAYAVQWWGFAVAAFAVLGYYLLAAAGAPATALRGSPASRGSHRSEPTDEQWEDAADP